MLQYTSNTLRGDAILRVTSIELRVLTVKKLIDKHKVILDVFLSDGAKVRL